MCITDEDEWIYADPANKVEKKKNAWIHHWLTFIEEDLPPTVTRGHRLVGAHMLKNGEKWCLLGWRSRWVSLRDTGSDSSRLSESKMRGRSSD